MKHRVFVVSLIVSLLAFPSLAQERRQLPEKVAKECKGKDVVLLLGDLGETFNRFLGGRLDVFAEEPTCWNIVKVEKYDKFFWETNLTIAYFRLAQRLITIMKQAVEEKAVVSPETDFVIAAVALLPLVKEAIPRIREAQKAVEELTASAKQDFSGLFDKPKLIKVTENLAVISKNIAWVLKELDSLVSGLEQAARYAKPGASSQ